MIPEGQDKQQKEAYQQTFETVANKYGTGACRFFHDSGEIMAHLHNLKGDEHILDVASGTGAAAIPLAHQLLNGEVTAVDFSASMLNQAKTRAENEQLNNLNYQIHDMTAMPFNDGQFDHANCAFGLFFVEDMVSLLSHIKSKVKPGGNVMISSFCGDSFMPAGELFFNRLRKYGLDIPETPSGWKRIAEPEKLYTLFSEAGLHDVTITRKSLGYYTTPEGWWEVIWNAGFRGLVAQLDDKLDDFKHEHLQEVESLMDGEGLWLEVDVNFTQGVRPNEF